MLTRREWIAAAAGAAAVTMNGNPRHADPEASQDPIPIQRKKRIRQSVCRWCYGGISLDDLCKEASRIGLASVELLDSHEWQVPRKYGLVCAVGNAGGSIANGWNHVKNHESLTRDFEKFLPMAKEAGVPNLITFSGNRKGISDEEGMQNCIQGLKRIAHLAEKNGVTVLFELLNSKVDHGDYQCDHTRWGVGVVKAVGSERIKLLYDIYHMQIMEGDVIRTIRDNIAYIGHFHTGGVPGRNEIDDTQELHYPAICRAIVETGYKGFLAQEFVPSRDPLTSLRQAVDICDV
jgi:hydroxypyruvate isomerase